MESVWWVFKQLWDKGLVYQDFRVMPFSWRLSTALSNFEANMDYRDARSCHHGRYAPGRRARLFATDLDHDPLTLPSNLAIAVGDELEYVKATRPDDPQFYIVAKERLDAVLGDDAVVVETITGSQLVGRHHRPLFSYFAEHPNAFQVIGSSHVTTGDGTGLVHMAPDFGEDDFNACSGWNQGGFERRP